MRTEWEWLIERCDGDPRSEDTEIVDVDHAATVDEAIGYSQCDAAELLARGIAKDCNGEWVALCVRKSTFKSDLEFADFEYHYVCENPDLTGVPKRIQRQLQVARQSGVKP